jgi:hypothetical protein
MATHDYEIANQTPANLRADLNNALLAIVTQNSSATAPATTFANMLWYDTANNQIKKRNEADSAWITLGTVDEGTGKFTPNAAITTSEIAATTLVTASDTIASNDNDTTIPTSAAVKDYVDALTPVQTWTSVIGSRSSGTTYTNSTGRPIYISVIAEYGNQTGDLYLTVGGNIIQRYYNNPDNTDMKLSVSGPIRAGATYSVTSNVGGSITTWYEMR